MNAVIAAMAQAINGDPTYAYLVTEDVIDGGNLVGAYGPRDQDHVELLGRLHATDAKLAEQGLSRWTWRLYDDDGEHYFTGVLVTTEATPEDDETGPNGALKAPLDGIGEAYGCTRITWDGHPEWEIS